MELVPVPNFQTKFGVLPFAKSTVLVILNFPILNPGGPGHTTATVTGVAIAASIRNCLLV